MIISSRRNLFSLLGFSDEQSPSLQGLLSSFKDPFESHSDPPFPGAGLSQVRDRLWVPPPHDAEQVFQFPNWDHLPSTESQNQHSWYLYVKERSVFKYLDIFFGNKSPLFAQTRVACFPFLPFWEHFPFLPLKQGLPFLKFRAFVSLISNSLHAALHFSVVIIFDPPVHRLPKK